MLNAETENWKLELKTRVCESHYPVSSDYAYLSYQISSCRFSKLQSSKQR